MTQQIPQTAMSTPTRKPFLSDEDLIGYITTNGVTLYSQHRMSPVDVRDKYEAHLAEKDALIQLLVDALGDSRPNWHEDAHEIYEKAFSAAKEAGFTPTTEP